MGLWSKPWTKALGAEVWFQASCRTLHNSIRERLSIFSAAILCHSAEGRNPLCARSPAPHAANWQIWSPQEAAEEGARDNHNVNMKQKGLCQSQVQVLAFKICLCPGSPAGNSTLQQSTATGLGKNSWSLGHKVLSWRSEMLLQPCPAQSKVWQQLGQSFLLSLRWELFQFSPLTAVSRGTLRTQRSWVKIPSPNQAKEIWAEFSPFRVPEQWVWCSLAQSWVLLSSPSAVYMATSLTVWAGDTNTSFSSSALLTHSKHSFLVRLWWPGQPSLSSHWKQDTGWFSLWPTQWF